MAIKQTHTQTVH